MSARTGGGGKRWPEAAARAVWRARMERLVQELTERPEDLNNNWLLERVKAKMVNERVKWMLEFQTKRQNKMDQDRKMDYLVKICGSAVKLVPDTLLLAKELLKYHVPQQQAHTTLSELSDAVTWLLNDPLFTALQAADPDYTAQCQYCQPDRPFRITCLNRSGSSAEGLSDGVIGKGGMSDFDIMHEIGPFTWTARPVSAESPAPIKPQAAPQLWAKPTKNAGFVTLHWVPTTQCSHEAPLGALPADSIRRLMERHCRIVRGGKITIAGPATNSVCSHDKTEGGIDCVPCLRLPGWWPGEGEFVNRHREADFPPAEARDDMRKFGVHLVPTGRPGSETEAIEWRISLSRAEIVAAYNLSAVQHATITTVKQMKNTLEKNRTALTDKHCTLKSYFVKTAVLWLVQDKPSGSWAGVSDGVCWVLDWLEQHLSTGTLPCFFWDEINIVAELKHDQLHAIISTVQLMRRQANRLLITCCLNWNGLDILLEDGTEPLTERQLRHRLGRLLVRNAVAFGTIFRPDAPFWEHWMHCRVPVLARASQDRLFQWNLRHKSSAYQQQCGLLQAWTVIDSEDITDGAGMASLHGDIVTLDVTPLVSLLTEADLVFLLGDPAAVAAWCRRQLRRPPAERPAGLTAELDTPRGRAELLLQPELLLGAIREAVPWKLSLWESLDRKVYDGWKKELRPLHTLKQCKELLEYHLQ